MKITFDKEANAVYIYLKDDIIVDTEEEKNGQLIIDYAANGKVVGIEILNASDKLDFPLNINYVEL